MKHQSSWLAALISIFFVSSACTKGVPDIAQLRLLSGFTLDQSSTRVTSKSSPAFSVSGKCESKFSDVEISLDAGQSWSKISSVATTVDVKCSVNGTFQSQLDFSAIPLDGKRWSAAGAYESLFFRGVSEQGFSDSQMFKLETTMPGAHFSLLGGGVARTSLSGGYRLIDRVHSASSSSEVTPEGYRLKAAVW